MSLRITKESEHVTGTAYARAFYFPDHVGTWGFSFDCDRAGTVDVAALNPAAAANYRGCIDGTIVVVDGGIEARPFAYRVPAEGRCTCGALIVLYGDAMGDTDCDGCGRIYTSSGQELAPRWQWGEETGEYFGAPPCDDY